MTTTRTRRCKVSGIEYLDATKSTIFASKEYRFPYEQKQLTDFNHYAVECKNIPFDDKERVFTEEFRRSEKAISHVWNCERLHQKPMLSSVDDYALLLPLPEDGNETGQDWLSYTDPLYISIVTDISREIYKKFGPDSDEYQESKFLLVDYSYCYPFGPTLRHDGTYKTEKWDDEKIITFGRYWTNKLDKNFYHAGETGIVLPEYIPSVKSTKSLGFYNTWPDGSKINKFEDGLWFVPRSLASDEPNNLYRYNNAPVRFEYLDQGVVLDNLNNVLYHPESYNNPKSFMQNVFNMSASIHTEAYRTNNPRVPLCDKGEPFENIGHLYTTDKGYAYEIEPYVFNSGTYNGKKWCDAFVNLNPKHQLCVLTKRPIFPGPNAQFGISFTQYCNCSFHKMELGKHGFLSLHKTILNTLVREIRRHVEAGYEIVIISFDRSNSEQFITDNFEQFINLFQGKQREFLSTISKAVVPSLFGGRYVEGLISGGPPTTLFNATSGSFEYSNLLHEIIEAFRIDTPFKDYEKLSRTLCEYWNDENVMSEVLKVTPDFSVYPTLGTDDQNLIMFCKGEILSKFNHNLEKFCDDYKEGRSLKMEVANSVTSFGIHVHQQGANANESLGISKLWLTEKSKNGDHCACKYHARLQLLSKVYDIIQLVFEKHKCGRLTSYEKGARNFFENVARFGWPVDEFWVKESPKDQIILGAILEEYGIDPTKDVITYSQEQMFPLWNSINKFLRSAS